MAKLYIYGAVHISSVVLTAVFLFTGTDLLKINTRPLLSG